ncbi:MAG TPA: valine--tRNA ligase [Chthoniobacterales bacterium]|jgi:valyl-tRNA synthetase
MSEISKTYEPQAIEEKWYADWLAKGCFTADPESSKEAYSIVIPPPNVTGVLTLGHVLNNTIQDILARRARMLGKEVLWLPGTDHAGIATQNVVEKSLRKAGEIKHRDDLGREKLVEKIWQWKEEYGGKILKQLRALGASCDWSRTRFTMDPEYSACVQRVFVDLYNKGLIYRGKRMVNWCPVALTALSDEEVIMKPTNGLLYYFKVEVADVPNTFLTIATTRPETIPGDTAIAVNPNDPRYAHLIGKQARRPLPLDNQALIPIVAEDSIDIAFGTGVLKVTPAHDKADFEIGQRHQLETIEVIDPRGVMNALAGADLTGLERFEARKKAAELLREMGALEKEEPYQNNVGYSERADVPVEPRLSEQWFLKYPSVEESRAVVADGQMKFYPDRWAKVYEHWLGGLQDWCISRQLWWGHRVPVWYRVEQASSLLPTNDHKLEACATPHVGIEPPPDSENWVQDPDVLDTWFSSWLWPFATMGWPNKTPELAKFYPTTDLVTGPDIIFFWVARMIMAGYEWMDEMPFRNVYFTGIIRDKQGRKMSKSLGNSPDPLDIIAKYGADALRFGVMRSAPLGQDVLFDEKNVELGRNFCTKLWNAARFRQMYEGATEGEINPELLTSDDRWILLRLDGAIREVSAALDEYRFSDAAQTLYRFFWSEYCDWYLEASKAALGRVPLPTEAPMSPEEAAAAYPLRANTLAVMDFILAHTLRLMHPFLPFITEELWQSLGFREDLPTNQGGETIMFAVWPQPFDEDFRAHYGLTSEAEANAIAKYDTVLAGRNLRSTYNIPSNKRVRFVLQPTATLPSHDAEVLKILLNAETLDVTSDYVAPQGTPTNLTPLGHLFLPLEGLIDVTAERERLGKEITKVSDELAKVRAKLGNPGFTEKVPASVLEEHRQRETNWQEKLAQLEKMLAALG